MIYGREREARVLAGSLDAARSGHGTALVLRGEAGIGKSALLCDVSERAGAEGDMLVLTAIGVETEQDLPFAGLHMLLAPVADRIDALPERQAAVLHTALGTADGPVGDRFQTAIALHALLNLLAAEQPVLCVIDDAHWIDASSADALLFTARRLRDEGAVMLFAARDGHAPAFPAPGIPELILPRLDRESSAALLADHAPGLSRQVSELVLREAAGNPLALKELPTAHREGALEPFGSVIGADRVRHGFTERVANLPSKSRALILLAALDGSGDLHTLVRAAAHLDAGLADLEPAERKGLLVAADDRVSFPHPLIRSAAVQSASLAERLAAHAALAEALVGDSPDCFVRRTLHLAAATTGPDESVAQEVEESASCGRGQAAYGTAAATYERAARLSPAPADRGRRLALAARAAADAGDAPRAAALAEQATPLVADPAVRAGLAQISALDPYFRGNPGTAARLLIDGAGQAAAHEPVKAAFMLLDGTGTAWVSGQHSTVRAALATTEALRLPDDAVDAHTLRDAAAGLARVALGEPGIPALHALYTGDVLRQLAPLERACALEWVIATGDLPLAEHLLSELADEYRATATGALPEVLRDLTRVRLLRGHLHDADATARAAERIAEETDQPFFAAEARDLRATIAAWQGTPTPWQGTPTTPPPELALALALADGTPSYGTPSAGTPLYGTLSADGMPSDGTLSAHGTPSAAARAAAPPAAPPAARAVLALSRGDLDDALALLDVVTQTELPNVMTRYLALDRVEVLARLGRPDDARAALDAVTPWAAETGQDWARGLLARAEAHLSPDPSPLWAEALTHLASSPRPLEHARTLLGHGSWLRRTGHPSAARPSLRTAAETFTSLGATLWADRARAELRAAGDSGPLPSTPPTAALSPQERRVVRLAAAGLTNRQIGERLFLSPRTVGYHLYNAYPKLGISSRIELPHLTLPNP
ncbi:helix-turn-helix transcriptional regulator [Actinocorallia sp. A-T 12471]|uniref:helix-turn-helix transcriptional regulator n=1 Tax=Actinocorallia sp. A-T 12471 TaxID=3089813 RepID=UPI0029CDF174|nr:AAA family ATPase [Actinocorallia sp. A-T 12471]MDX6742005.1 AAA family ATPase [Actinocorallia sp. A-T 12471]